MTQRVGVIAIARPTFDVGLAKEMTEAAFRLLSQLDLEIVGTGDLLLDSEATGRAVDALRGESLDGLIIIQATFTDSTMPVAAAAATDAPLVLWALPEERTGGRLRLNSLCGINLAGYALSWLGRTYGYVYRRPDEPEAMDELMSALISRNGPSTATRTVPDLASMSQGPVAKAEATREFLAGATIGLIGDHPAGFEPCAFDRDAITDLTGVSVDHICLQRLFDSAESASADEIRAVRRRLSVKLTGLDGVEQEPLEKSLRLHLGLKQLVRDHAWRGVAVRCWPECFTEYGGAACAAMGMLTSESVPACCEADVYGAVTSLILQSLAGGSAFVADLVDIDRRANTGVMWHCGLAPLDMADGLAQPRATVHPNREKPLLSEFALRPGRVTIARLSQARGTHKLAVGGGEMIGARRCFSGTSGVLRFDRPVASVLDTIMTEGLEHHYGLAYGDVREELEALAALLGLPIVELG
jgi:L-fucose isomerase-like protein